MNWQAIIEWLGWSMIQAVATVLLLGGVWWAFWQVRTTKQATQAQLSVDLFEKLRTEEAKETYRLIYNTPREQMVHLSDNNQKAIESIMDRLELVGILLHHKIIDNDLVIEEFGGVPLRCRYQLKDWLEKKREERGRYAGGFDEFVKRSLKYEIEHRPRKEWPLLNTTEKRVELIPELMKDRELLSKFSSEERFFLERQFKAKSTQDSPETRS